MTLVAGLGLGTYTEIRRIGGHWSPGRVRFWSQIRITARDSRRGRRDSETQMLFLLIQN